MDSQTLPPPLPQPTGQIPPPVPNYMIIDNRKILFINKENITLFRNTMLGNHILFDDLQKEERCILFYPKEKFYSINCKDFNNKACFEKIRKGELMFRATLTYLYDFVEEFIIQSLCDGIIVWNPEIHDVSNGEMIYTIYKNENEIFDSFFKAELQVNTDEFTKQITISTIHNFPICNFDISINIKLIEHKHQLIVNFDPKEIHAKKINTMNLLFEDGDILSLTNFTEPYKDGKLITQKTLRTSEINLLANKKISRINIVNKQGVVIYENRAFYNVFYYSRHGVKQEFVDELKEKAFRVYLQDYLKKYQELGLNESDIIVLDIKDMETPEAQKCSVYLMHDTSNNTFKIGISNKPKYRERTLLSEKPTIELICYKEFPNRKIAESLEKALHNAYSDKRIRGEWFMLDDKEIKELKETLSN